MIKFAVYDTGLFVTQAEALSEGGKNEVRYVTNWGTRFPKYADHATGKYLGNIKKEYYFAKLVKDSDALVNFDVAGQDWIGFLRELYPNKSIFGSGYGCVLEDDRLFLKKVQKEAGLPVQEYDVVYGVKNLREYLQKHDEIYVKFNKFRYDMESFFAKSYDSVKLKIDKLALSLGPHADDDDPKNGFLFICEKKIEGGKIESGFDGIFNGTEFVSPCFCGVESNKGPYFARVFEYDELPDPIYETMEALTPILREFNYRGCVSTEEVIIDEELHYLLDFCGRSPSPLGVLYPKVIKNYAEAIFKVGKGEDVRLDIPYKYVAAFPFNDEDAREDFVRVNIEEGHEDGVSLLMGCGDKDGGHFAVKGLEEIGCAIGYGDTFDETFDMLKKNAEYIDSPQIEKGGIDHIDEKFKEIFKKGEEAGVYIID
jgi:hypothetical protein